MLKKDADWARELLLPHLAPGTQAGDLIVHGPLTRRDYSRVFRVQSSALPSASVMKLCLKTGSFVPNPRDARQQYSILEKIHAASANRGLHLVPQPYLLMEPEGVFLAEWIKGDIMATRLFGWELRFRPVNRLNLIKSAAEWLRSFHQLLSLPSGPLELQSKVLTLKELEADGFQENEIFRNCAAYLARCADRAGSVQLERSWLHGDFKADNLIVTGEKTIGIDIQAQTCDAIIYDIAQFLNNIELNVRYLHNRRLFRTRETLYDHFIHCYFGPEHGTYDLPLLWIRGYMLLCGWHEMKNTGSSIGSRLTQNCYRAATRDLCGELAMYC